jgi:hypothetical protein
MTLVPLIELILSRGLNKETIGKFEINIAHNCLKAYLIFLIRCICVYRWNQAQNDGHAPKVVLGATNIEALSYLKKFNKTLNDLSR